MGRMVSGRHMVPVASTPWHCPRRCHPSCHAACVASRQRKKFAVPTGFWFEDKLYTPIYIYIYVYTYIYSTDIYIYIYTYIYVGSGFKEFYGLSLCMVPSYANQLLCGPSSLGQNAGTLTASQRPVCKICQRTRRLSTAEYTLSHVCIYIYTCTGVLVKKKQVPRLRTVRLLMEVLSPTTPPGRTPRDPYSALIHLTIRSRSSVLSQIFEDGLEKIAEPREVLRGILLTPCWPNLKHRLGHAARLLLVPRQQRALRDWWLETEGYCTLT